MKGSRQTALTELTLRSQELERDLAKMSIAMGNENIKNEMQMNNL